MAESAGGANPAKQWNRGIEEGIARSLRPKRENDAHETNHEAHPGPPVSGRHPARERQGRERQPQRPWKERGAVEKAIAPERIVDVRRRRQVVLPRGGELGRIRQTPRQPLAVGAPVGQQDGQERDRCQASREHESAGNPLDRPGLQVGGPGDHACDRGEEREDQQVDGSERLEHKRQREDQGGTQGCPRNHLVEREDHNR